MTERIDCHTHTYLSGHGVGTVEEVVSSACAQGLASVALTEHLALPTFMDSSREVSMDPSDLKGYCEAVISARSAHPEIDVICGMEIDWIEGNSEYDSADLGEVTFLLGSVHYLDTWAFDSPNELQEWDRRDIDEVWARYFELWMDAVKSDIPFDVMAHPDLPKKFGHRPSLDMIEIYSEIARCAADNNVAIEVNTAGLRKPVAELYPEPTMLKAFCQAGVESCVGSDAHAPSEVGFGIDLAYRALREAGYTRLICPTPEGEKRYISL